MTHGFQCNSKMVVSIPMSCFISDLRATHVNYIIEEKKHFYTLCRQCINQKFSNFICLFCAFEPTDFIFETERFFVLIY